MTVSTFFIEQPFYICLILKRISLLFEPYDIKFVCNTGNTMLPLCNKSIFYNFYVLIVSCY